IRDRNVTGVQTCALPIYKEATLVEARNTQEAQKAKLEADKLIAQNQRDTDLAKAEYTAEVKKQQAVADNAYKIAEVEQQQYVNEKLVKTNETQYQATIITKQKADAQALVIDSKAKAEQIQIETEAQANQTKVLAEANSEKITKEGKAQADAQKALAEALEKNGQYALQKAIIDVLPQIANSFAQSVANIDSLTVFDGADGVGRQSVAGLSETLSFVKQSTGIDLANYIQKQAVGTRTIEGQFQLQKNKVKSKKGRGFMLNQDPKELFKQSIKELKEAIIELKQAWKELNEKLDELHQEILGRWW